MGRVIKRTKITIGILTYNHERYIEECLASVILQVGDFDLTVIIVNDKSKDGTDKVIKKFIKENKDIKIEYVVNETNLGAQKSIFKTLSLIRESKPDYWAYIEGDDKYLSADRTQKHLELLKSDSSAMISYNKLLLIDEDSNPITEHEPEYLSNVLSTYQLASQNHIGSFCATFYSAKCFDFFDPSEFEGLVVYDWFFNIWISRFGTIRLLKEYLTGYRQHSTSVWSSMSQTKQFWELIWSIDSYNEKLDFAYDGAFQSYKRSLVNQLAVIGNPMAVDIIVFSNGFMLPNDEFSNGETKRILESSNSIVDIASSKRSSSFTEAIRVYKQDNPTVANKILGYDGDYNVLAKCVYATSIDDAYYRALPITNFRDSFLVFEVSKGDESKLDNSDTLKKLKSICRSMNFVHVIVHSEDAKQYLINRKLCEEDRIGLIPSIVSEKIYGRNNIYGPDQLESYYIQISNLLRRCLEGELQPLPPRLNRKIKMRYMNSRSAIIGRSKELLKRNKVSFIVARTVVKIIRTIKGVRE